MGVRTFIANRFTAARLTWPKWKRRLACHTAPRRDSNSKLGRSPAGPALDLLSCYRQDEILMLIRLMEGLGVKIGSFEHVLEGYKVADEIAKHGRPPPPSRIGGLQVRGL